EKTDDFKCRHCPILVKAGKHQVSSVNLVKDKPDKLNGIIGNHRNNGKVEEVWQIVNDCGAQCLEWISEVSKQNPSITPGPRQKAEDERNIEIKEDDSKEYPEGLCTRDNHSDNTGRAQGLEFLDYYGPHSGALPRADNSVNFGK